MSCRACLVIVLVLAVGVAASAGEPEPWAGEERERQHEGGSEGRGPVPEQRVKGARVRAGGVHDDGTQAEGSHAGRDRTEERAALEGAHQAETHKDCRDDTQRTGATEALEAREHLQRSGTLCAHDAPQAAARRDQHA